MIEYYKTNEYIEDDQMNLIQDNSEVIPTERQSKKNCCF